MAFSYFFRKNKLSICRSGMWRHIFFGDFLGDLCCLFIMLDFRSQNGIAGKRKGKIGALCFDRAVDANGDDEVGDRTNKSDVMCLEGSLYRLV